MLKIRGRHFKGRCARHKMYNPAIDGQAGIKGGCQRCMLLLEIWETSLKLNAVIRRFDPAHDDVKRRPRTKEAAADPRQMSLI